MPSMLEVIPVLPAVRYRCPTKQWRVLICLLQLGLCYDELAMGRLNFVIVFEHRWWLMFGNYEWLSCIATWLLYILVTLNRVWSPVFARPFYVHNLVRLCAYIERGTHFWHPLTSSLCLTCWMRPSSLTSPLLLLRLRIVGEASPRFLIVFRVL